MFHAVYGTDGFPVSLLAPGERHVLTELIGEDAEALVYIYASCDRRSVYPRLALPGSLRFTDRFTGLTSTIPESDAGAFVELTAANELDLVRTNPGAALDWGPKFAHLLRDARHRLSTTALQAWTDAVSSLTERSAPTASLPVSTPRQ